MEQHQRNWQAAARSLPVRWKPVDEKNLFPPPLPWALIRSTLPEGYHDKVSRFWTTVVEDGNEKYLEGPVIILGESFKGRVVHLPKEGLNDIGDFSGKRWTAACEDLSREFGNLIPPLLWEVIASLGVREDPLLEAAIPNVQDELPYPWGICDAALHAMSKSYELFFHIEERLRAGTGHILLHGCGCSHVVRELKEASGEYRFPTLDGFRRAKAGREFLDHFLSELDLIFVRGYPFRMNPEELRSVAIVGS